MIDLTQVDNPVETFKTLVEKNTLVIAAFYPEGLKSWEDIAPLYESLADARSRPPSVTFVKAYAEAFNLAELYDVQAVPAFIVFRDGKVCNTFPGMENPSLLDLGDMIESLAVQIEKTPQNKRTLQSGESALAASQPWEGATVPRGYVHLGEEVEIRNCELLNADQDAGPVKVLFDSQRPAALTKEEGSAKDFVQSGADDQLLLFIPFQSSVKLHTLQITSLPEDGQEDVTRPEVIHLYINRPQNMDFGEADDTEPTQAITLSPEDWNSEGTANISLRFVKFQKTTTLILYVQKGLDGASTVRLDRVRLIGEVGTKREMGKLQKAGDEE